MFTQCPTCSTVYQVSAADLTVERGKVHCSFCDAYFDSLASLTDHPPAHGPPARGLSAPATPVVTTAADDREPRDDFDDDSPTGEVPLLSPQERGVPDVGGATPDTGEPEGEDPQDTMPPELAGGAPEAIAAEQIDAGAISAADVAENASAPAPVTQHVDASIAPAVAAAATQPHVVHQAQPAAIPQAQPDGISEPEPEALDIDALRGIRRNPWARAGWSVVAVIMLLLLSAQLVHRSRSELIMQPAIAPWMHRIYGALGLRLDPKWEVERYRIVRRPEMSTAVSADGAARLRFVATLTNDAARPQPYPVVRLTLEDRWGSAVGARDFAPGEYLHDDARAASLLAPGEQAQVDVLVVDPGADTVGFTVDMCLVDADGVMRCANDDS